MAARNAPIALKGARDGEGRSGHSRDDRHPRDRNDVDVMGRGVVGACGRHGTEVDARGGRHGTKVRWRRAWPGPTIGGVMRVLCLVAAVMLSVAPAQAALYDGSTPMQCAIQTVMVCDDPSICVRGTAQTVSLPSVLKVDVGGRLVSGDAAGRTIKITAVGRGGGRLLLHGDEIELGGTAWNVVIVEDSGAMTGAVLSRSGGFLLFGACSAARAAS